MIQGNEKVIGVLIESGEGQKIDEIIADLENGASEIELDREMYQRIQPYLVEVNTKYKPVAKNIRPAATPLPKNAKEILEGARNEPRLRDPSKIGHVFSPDIEALLKVGGDGLTTQREILVFRNMITQHGRALAFLIDKIGYVDPKVVMPMVVFTVPHLPWDLKLIPMPRALLPKLVELLKEKLDAS